MSETVAVASTLPFAVLAHVDAGPGVEASRALVGRNDPGAVDGYGLTYEVNAAALDQWLTANPRFAAFIAIATQQQIDDHSDPQKTYGFEAGIGEPIDPIQTAPPVNVDVPFIWQEEQRMRCTMGNWQNYPTLYGYQWVQDGTLNIGANNDTLPLLASNDGHSITCVVTASNDAGSTAAPPSNAVVYHAPTTATAALLISGDFSDAEWDAMIAQVGSNASAWQGFDIVVDGLNLTLRAQFPAIVTADDICAVINTALGAYLTASVVTTFAPWQFNIHSKTTGLASTISYAAAPSYLASDPGSATALMESVVGKKASTDLSLVLRLRQSVGAITVQGIDATTP
jgi:hypothetical protein